MILYCLTWSWVGPVGSGHGSLFQPKARVGSGRVRFLAGRVTGSKKCPTLLRTAVLVRQMNDGHAGSYSKTGFNVSVTRVQSQCLG